MNQVDRKETRFEPVRLSEVSLASNVTGTSKIRRDHFSDALFWIAIRSMEEELIWL